jgi:Domain of unknown function (DUF5666)
MSRRPTIRILLAFPLGLAWHALLAASGKPKKLDGYAEWHQGDLLIVDGQRVRTTPRTKYKLRDVAGVNLVPLGFRVEARGVRDASGVIVADALEAQPNAMAFLEGEVLKATNAIEAR